jgi:hypothetical protein
MALTYNRIELATFCHNEHSAPPIQRSYESGGPTRCKERSLMWRVQHGGISYAGECGRAVATAASPGKSRRRDRRA